MSGLAEEEMNSSAGQRWLRAVAIAVALLATVAGVVYLLKGLGDSGSPARKQVTRISVLPDTPPPPPPPPPKDEPKPQRETKDLKVEKPKPAEAPQEAQPLKMEGAAGDGPSPFSAGAVSRDYVGGPTGTGSVGGSKLMQGAFAERLQRHLQAELNRNRKLKQSDYRVNLRVWLGRDGGVQRAELVQSTGNPSVDELLEQTLLQVAAMREAPPENMPQPIRLRITARGSS